MSREERFERGLKVLQAVDGEAGRKVIASLTDVSPELGHQVVSWAFGEIYARPELPPRDRQLVTLGILTALGGCEPQLEVHINAALNVGLTPPRLSRPCCTRRSTAACPERSTPPSWPRRCSPTGICCR
jgi:4-carboxymuconolactone decarboxylase